MLSDHRTLRVGFGALAAGTLLLTGPTSLASATPGTNNGDNGNHGQGNNGRGNGGNPHGDPGGGSDPGGSDPGGGTVGPTADPDPPTDPAGLVDTGGVWCVLVVDPDRPCTGAGTPN